MKEHIGIGILDIYDQEDLESCYSSIPEEYRDNVLIASATNNSIASNIAHKKFNEVSMATLRNWIISKFRIDGLKYIFIISSNQIIDDPKIFEKTIKLGETFGTWFILGDGKNSLPMEDESTGNTIYATPEMNSDFMFILSGIVSNTGYFDERFYNTKDLDVLDYIMKLRKKGIYPPANYNLSIGNGVKGLNKPIKKIKYADVNNPDRSVGISYGYFKHIHNYLPGVNDPSGITQEKLIEFMQELQKNYAKR